MSASKRTRPPLGLAVAVALLTAAHAGGCAFDREWRRLNRAQRAAAQSPTTAPADATADPLAGRWVGRWVSDRNGHTGKLRAIVKPLDAATYRVDYDAMYMTILRFGYGMELRAATSPGAAPGGNAVTFEGQENLGPLAGGVYRYTGAADGRTFTATYQSRYDHGRFEMTRPK